MAGPKRGRYKRSRSLSSSNTNIVGREKDVMMLTSASISTMPTLSNSNETFSITNTPRSDLSPPTLRTSESEYIHVSE